MTGNPTPWLILLAAVVATLALKGYIKVPSFLSRAARRTEVQPVAKDNPKQATWPLDPLGDLSYLDSRTLGLAFAVAMRREAETELAHKIASDAGDAIKATFQSPFSPPAPAGQDQAKPADFPPIA